MKIILEIAQILAVTAGVIVAFVGGFYLLAKLENIAQRPLQGGALNKLTQIGIKAAFWIFAAAFLLFVATAGN